jgi:hypothetical protein
MIVGVMAWGKLSLLVCLIGNSALLAAQHPERPSPDPFLGEWRLNKAKTPDAPPAAPVVIMIEAAGIDTYKFTFTLRDPQGQTSKEEYVRTFDGKPRPVPNDPTSTRTFQRLDARTLKMTSQQQDGKRTATHTYTAAADGKSLSDQYRRTNQDAIAFTHTARYERK